MRRVCWLTDLHFNCLDSLQIARFLEQAAATKADAFLISGDIGEAHSVADYLRILAQGLSMPVYFVLGNHDYYFGSIREVRGEVTALCRAAPSLHWLVNESVVELAPHTGLVGHDGWADARLGDYVRSLVMMHDYALIGELARHSKQDRWPLLKKLGDEAADHFRRVLPEALERYPQVLLLTHVPPFRDACWHEGAISNDEWLPHFTCQAAGEAILEVMYAYPDRQLTVLCGHTHGAGEARPAENVVVYTGGARYGEPEIQRVLDVD